MQFIKRAGKMYCFIVIIKFTSLYCITKCDSLTVCRLLSVTSDLNEIYVHKYI